MMKFLLSFLFFFLSTLSAAVTIRDHSQLLLSSTSTSAAFVALNHSLTVGDFPPEETVKSQLWTDGTLNAIFAYNPLNSLEDARTLWLQLHDQFFPKGNVVGRFWTLLIGKTSDGGGIPLRGNTVNEKFHVKVLERNYATFISGAQDSVSELYTDLDTDLTTLKTALFASADQTTWDEVLRIAIGNPTEADITKYPGIDTLNTRLYALIDTYGSRTWKGLDEQIVTTPLTPEAKFMLASWFPKIIAGGKMAPMSFLTQMLLLYVVNPACTKFVIALPVTTQAQKNYKQVITKIQSSVQGYAKTTPAEIATYLTSLDVVKKNWGESLAAIGEYFTNEFAYPTGTTEEARTPINKLNCFEVTDQAPFKCAPEKFLVAAPADRTVEQGPVGKARLLSIWSQYANLMNAFVTLKQEQEATFTLTPPDVTGTTWQTVFTLQVDAFIKNPGKLTGWEALGDLTSTEAKAKIGKVTIGPDGVTMKRGTSPAETEPWANPDGSVHLQMRLSQKDEDGAHRDAVMVFKKANIRSSGTKWFKLVKTTVDDQFSWATEILQLSIMYEQKLKWK